MSRLIRLGWMALWLLFCQSISADEPQPATDQQRELKIGVDLSAFPNQMRSDLEVILRYWAEELGNEAKVTTRISIYETATKEMATDFKNGLFNLLITTPLQFVMLIDKADLASGFFAQQNSSIADGLIVLTRKASGYTNFKQLRGKKVDLIKNAQIYDIYLQTLCADAFQQSSKQTLSVSATEKNPEKLILKLFFNQVDAIVTNKGSFLVAAELNPQIAQSLQIIDEITGISSNVGYFHISVPEDFREDVIQKVMHIRQYRHGQALLDVFKADGIDRSRVEDLLPVENIYRRYQQIEARAH